MRHREWVALANVVFFVGKLILLIAAVGFIVRGDNGLAFLAFALAFLLPIRHLNS